jgi:hypothetical protein
MNCCNQINKQQNALVFVVSLQWFRGLPANPYAPASKFWIREFVFVDFLWIMSFRSCSPCRQLSEKAD